MNLISIKLKHVSLETDGDKYFQNVRINELKLEDIIASKRIYHSITCNYIFPDKHQIEWTDEFIEMYLNYLTDISSLYERYPCLAPYLNSYMYGLINQHWSKLLEEGKILHGLILLKDLLTKTLKMQDDYSLFAHKGTLYGFIAYTYLILGDSYTGFSYLHCALKDDEDINNNCTSLNYPIDAPCYKTLCLLETPDNFMHHFAIEVKNYLRKYLNLYVIDFKKYDINVFFKQFVENDSFRYMKTYFVYSFWTIFYNSQKYQFEKLDNTFYQLTNLTSLLNISFVIDNVLQYFDKLNKNKYDKKGNIMFGERIHKFIELNSPSNLIYYEDLKKSYKHKTLDKTIKDLLKDEIDLDKKKIKFLLITLLLRNKAAHEIDIHEISKSTYFNKLLSAQLYVLLSIFDHYNYLFPTS